MRRAEVQVEIDAKTARPRVRTLHHAHGDGGPAALADSTAGWGTYPKRSSCPYGMPPAPIVDTTVWPSSVPLPVLLTSYAVLQRTVHLGERTATQRTEILHDYGFDVAGYEAKEDGVSATEARWHWFGLTSKALAP